MRQKTWIPVDTIMKMLFRGAKDLRGSELISSTGKIVLKALPVLIAPILQLVRPKMTIDNLGGDSVFETEWQSTSLRAQSLLNETEGIAMSREDQLIPGG